MGQILWVEYRKLDLVGFIEALERSGWDESSAVLWTRMKVMMAR
jgi:hypothetical protein